MHRRAPDAFDPDGPKVRKLRRRMLNRWILRMYMLRWLPLGLIAGLRVRTLDGKVGEATVPYRWLTTNPFRSTYFAALSMAAELSQGALGMAVVESAPEPVSILIVGMEAEFVKKATDLTTFRCEGGEQMAEAVVKTLETGEPVRITLESVGRNESGLEVARFRYAWSFKRKR
ncbi:MAG: DUF4442 domain-containing protein [Deltaproteobacteria bacterium]|nr:DUF4442 domain-containing protein [Deltaproteobacteria bacterium]